MNGSILYAGEERFAPIDVTVLDDLRIGKILRRINQGNSAFVEELYRRKPDDPEDVLFRLSCMQELERAEVRDIIAGFLAQYERYREEHGNGERLSQRQTKQKWFLDAAMRYCDSILFLKDSLAQAGVRSAALARFLHCLERYAETEEFVALHRDARRCADRLLQIRYSVEISLNQNRVMVTAEKTDPQEAEDLFQGIAKKFQRYELSAASSVVPFPGVNMGTLETSILERLNGLFPDAFALLEEFCRVHPTYNTALTDLFVEELKFYLTYLRYMDQMRQRGNGFSYPCFSAQKTIRIEGGYDLALAQEEDVPVSVADFARQDGQSFLITGPNHGGKTTYACMVGQNLYLASLGLPVPCRALHTYFLRGLHTHFAKNEDLSTNAGRLKEELQRVKVILDRIAEDDFVIFNDLFASTTTYDARQMGKRILERFLAQGCLFLFVTHIGELAGDCPGLLSLYAAREEGNGGYVVVSGTADRTSGRSQWVQRYHLRREDILERVRV